MDTNGDGTDESFNAGQTATIAGIGELTIAADGAYTFTPVADYNGPVPVATYSMSDDGGTTTGDTSTLTISVTPVNDAFADDDEIVSIAEDTQATGNVLDASPNPTGDGAVEVTTFAVDTNGDGTDESFNAGQTATIAGIGELTIAADGAYTFTPVADYNGPVPVATYSMSDDGGTTTGDTSTLTISVTPVNDAFADDDEIVSIAEDTQATGNVLDASPNPTGDGAVEVTTFAVDTNGDGTDESFNAGQTATIAGIGELTIAADGAYTFTPVADYNGPVPVATYSMSDDGGTTTGDTSTLTISVTPVNDAFADDDEIVSIAEDTQATGNVLDASRTPPATVPLRSRPSRWTPTVMVPTRASMPARRPPLQASVS
ncbi:MAG: tandem-95 repeat protein [Halomonas sp.]|uniref:tandem-95 repeat protein n=1 Tax=Halomonas sp. TaxID=1486246 RepID=UPI002ACE264E|nr:tandem-95 repeat protein [Halomonas sp.]MDZ7852682.1 tandem-95 repeat protein [Halomonas sp.]